MRLIFLSLLIVPFFSYSSDLTAEQCKARSAFTGNMTNVWKEKGADYSYTRYANFEGCLYSLSGISVCNGEDASSCHGDWTPVGAVKEGGSGDGADESGAKGDGGVSGVSGGNAGLTPLEMGKFVAVPDPAAVVLPSGAELADSIDDKHAIYTKAGANGYILGDNADAVALSGILSDIKSNYIPVDLWFNRTDDYGHRVRLKTNEQKIYYRLNEKKVSPLEPNFINYEYEIKTHYTNYDPSNVCIYDEDTATTRCDESRLIAQSSHESSNVYTLQVMPNMNALGGRNKDSSGSANGDHHSSGNSGNTTSGNKDNGSSGQGGNGISGFGMDSFDYERMSDANKNAMTEEYDESRIKSGITSEFESVSSSLMAAFNNHIDSVSGLIQGGGQIGDEFQESAGYMSQVGNGDKSSLIDNFMKGGLFPALPSAMECRPIVFGEGKQYEFMIDCKYLDIFKNIFAFILYFWTFVTIYDTFTSILRNKG
ncbi:hypothetical protein PXH59_05685 [Xenorhabdus sp. SF857]|uniref:hypothetical protein n=1 Tax=Xenorhabdus bakwenae TaxID=3026967 RepID=UPI0025580F1A|nr:hypothetical protein [Xenorhabdus sp. SF857]WFQ80608.1 hypothetical protein PXH59_05630 [Xenorhabdus sp. SF857]WFQ80618.1 hypothetical protein PXH59_05685 [Xenorhabdus sp. SF857]